MRVDLLGYLLDALDDAERQRVEETLRTDPELQRRLESLQEQLQFLVENQPDESPAPGLAERTCDLVAAYQEQQPLTPAARPPAAGRRPWFSVVREGTDAARRWTLADTVVAAGVFLAAALLFFPALANSRYRSEITGCQHNLHQLGQALTRYSEQHQGLFPQIPAAGNRAVAGVYAPVLVESQQVTDPAVFICPASALARQREQWRVPSLEELDRARGRQLRMLQRSMGGSFGYNLGYEVNGRYRTPRNEYRPWFALISDSPSLHLAGHQSSNHGGRGQNVLFEDNHVEFIVCSIRPDGGDDLFLNRFGYTERGADEEDCVIGFSELSPLSLQP